MSIHVALNHLTYYRYDRPVMLGPQIVRLRPAPHCRTRILAYSLKIEPADHFINWQQDPQSNYLARLMFPKPTRELRIEVDLIAEMAVLNPFDFFLEAYAQHFPFRYEPADERELDPVPAHRAGDAAPHTVSGGRPARAAAHHRLPGGHQSPRRGRCPIPDPHGARRAAARSQTLEKRSRLVPGFGAAAWCSCCATWGSPRASSRAISSSSSPTRSRWMARRARARISRTSTPGARCICRAPDGSASIRPPACSPARGTSRSPARRSPPPRRRSRAVSTRARRRSSTP